MRIKSLHLLQFGPHEDLFLDFDASVAGLCGVNGAGKSTVLRAIRYAFTGLLDDKAETYVRNFQEERVSADAPPPSEDPPEALMSPKAEAWEAAGQPSELLTAEAPKKASKPKVPVDTDRPANGSVKLVFEKGGKEGVIFRQIGKTKRRYLEWAERVGKNAIKGDKEIDETLAGIFGADHQALDNAVFIPQGEMQHLLFGDDTQREKLYARMLLVSFCASVHSKVTEKIATLNAGLKDLTATRDEATAYLSSSRQELHQLLANRASLPELDAESVAIFDRWAELTLKMKNATETRDAAATALTAAEQSYQEATTHLTRLVGVPTPEAAKPLVAELAEAVGKAASAISLHAALATARQNLVTADKEAETSEAELAAAQDELTRLTTRILPSQQVQQLATQVRSARDAQQRIADIERMDQATGTINKELARLTPELAPKATEVTAAEVALEDAKRRVVGPRMTVDLLEKVKGIASDCCPVCKSKVSSATFSPETVAGARTELNLIMQEVEAKNTTLNKVRSESDQLTRKVQNFETELVGYKRRCSDILTMAGVPDIAQLRLRLMLDADLAAADLTLAEQQTLTSQKPVKDSMLARSQDRFNRAKQAQLAAAMQLNGAMNAVAGVQVVDAAQLQSDRHRLAQWTSALETFDRAATTHELRLRSSTAAMMVCDEARGLGQEIVQRVNTKPLLSDLMRKAGEHADPVALIQACRQSVSGYQSLVTEAEARKSQQERTVREAEQRQAQVERAMTENDQQRMVIEDLQGVARLFHRDGLPIYYMRMRFGEIVELTSHYLAMLDSDFLVRADPDRAVAFQFARLSASTDVWFSQNKLSGGQRVRLTVAFLLAINKLVIPDVGLLILDEPSMHLDEAGVESLRDMLQSIGGRLEGSEAQVIVCDHNPTIIDSLPKRIMLRTVIKARAVVGPPAGMPVIPAS